MLARVVTSPQTSLDNDAGSSQTRGDAVAVPPAVAEDPTRRFMKKRIEAIKLEVMSIGVLHLIFLFVWLVDIICVLISLAFTLSSYFVDSSNALASLVATNSVEAYVVVLIYYTVDGVMRSIGCVLLFFLVLAFPQRIGVDAIRHARTPLAEQVIIIAVVVVMSITPAYSIYELIFFWIQYIFTLSTSGSDIAVFLLNALNGLQFRHLIGEFNANVTVVVLVCIYLYAGAITFFQAHAHGWDVDGLLLPGKEVLNETNVRDVDEPVEAVAAAARAGGGNGQDGSPLMVAPQPLCCCYRAITASGVDVEVDDATCDMSGVPTLCTENACCARVRVRLLTGPAAMDCCQRARMSYAKAHRVLCTVLPERVPVVFVALLLAYAVISFCFVNLFDFHPSQVPVVGLVTIIRVCLTDANSYLSRSLVVENAYNITIVSYIQLSPNGTSVCYASNTVLQRAIAACVLAVLDVIILAHIVHLTRQSREHLVSLPYAATRGRQLGFNVFHHVSAVSSVCILSASLVSCAMSRLEQWVITSAVVMDAQSSGNPAHVAGLVVTLDPLRVVGVAPFYVGWSPFFVMMVVWVGAMAFSYLPPDSFGLKGWWTANQKDKPVGAGEYLVYVPSELEVAETLAELRRTQRRAARENEHAILEEIKAKGRGLFKGRGAFQQSSSAARAEREHKLLRAHRTTNHDPALVSQVKSNLLVLETEVLMYHFTHISYDVAALRGGVPLSLEAKAALVEDARFRLVEHLHGTGSDTHCLVVVSDDRIVVAFRGSVSLANWKTNWDSHLVEHPLGASVKPFIPDDLVTYARAKKVATYPPLVHGGFLKAYASVSDRLFGVVKSLKEQRPERVLFVTGHSLGGGLATVCAFDLALRLELRPGEVSLTTFGCPKVGTFSFTSRVMRVVPSARRFVMSGDIIVPLPIDPPFHSWSMLGWYHVGTEIMLDMTGNMIVRPSPVERSLLGETFSGPSMHMRLSYCSALMVWAVRSHADVYTPNWWPCVINHFYSKSPQVRLKGVAPNIRQRLLEDLVRPGTVYMIDKQRVRDFAVGTESHAAPALAELYAAVQAGVDEVTFGELVIVYLASLKEADDAGDDFVSAASESEQVDLV